MSHPPNPRRLRPVALKVLLALVLCVGVVIPTASPAAAADTTMFDFSNQNQRFWKHTTNGGSATSWLQDDKQQLYIALPNERAHAYAGRAPTTRNWNTHDGLRFEFKGLNTGMDVRLTFHEGPGRERFETTFVDSSSSARTVTIPFTRFQRDDWQPQGATNDGMNLIDVSSVYFGFVGPANGRIVMDNVALYDNQSGSGRPPVELVRANRAPAVDTSGGGLLQHICSTPQDDDQRFHVANDDPLVRFGRPGASHEHLFLGNQEIDAFSENTGGGPNDINRSSRTTCPGGGANLSGYWVPTLNDANGNVQHPDDVNIYYKRGPVNKNSLRNLPPGLRMIAGPGGTPPTDGAPSEIATWRCHDRQNRPAGPIETFIPECPRDGILKLFVTFPQCWSGVLWQADGNHMKYPNERDHGHDGNHAHYRKCGAGWQTIPEITFQFHWKLSGQDTRTWGLLSDHAGCPGNDPCRGQSLHGDWMNGWDVGTFNQILSFCIKGNKQCQNHVNASQQLKPAG